MTLNSSQTLRHFITEPGIVGGVPYMTSGQLRRFSSVSARKLKHKFRRPLWCVEIEQIRLRRVPDHGRAIHVVGHVFHFRLRVRERRDLRVQLKLQSPEHIRSGRHG